MATVSGSVSVEAGPFRIHLPLVFQSVRRHTAVHAPFRHSREGRNAVHAPPSFPRQRESRAAVLSGRERWRVSSSGAGRIPGASGLALSADVYAHVSRGMQERAVGRLDGLVGGGGLGSIGHSAR